MKTTPSYHKIQNKPKDGTSIVHYVENRGLWQKKSINESRMPQELAPRFYFKNVIASKQEVRGQ